MSSAGVVVLARALLPDVLAVAPPVDVEPQRPHREPVEDRRRHRRVAEVAAPALSLMFEVMAVAACVCRRSSRL